MQPNYEDKVNDKFAELITNASQAKGDVGIPLTRVDSAFVTMLAKADDFILGNQTIDHEVVQWHLWTCQAILTNAMGAEPKLKQFLSGLAGEIIVNKARVSKHKGYVAYDKLLKPYILTIAEEIDYKEQSISTKYMRNFKLAPLFDVLTRYKLAKELTMYQGQRLLHVSSFQMHIKKDYLYHFFGVERIKWLSRFGFQVMINEQYEWCLSDEVKKLESFDKYFAELKVNPEDPDSPFANDGIAINFLHLN